MTDFAIDFMTVFKYNILKTFMEQYAQSLSKNAAIP